MSDKKQNSVEWLESIVNAMIENGGDADLMAVIEHIQQAKAMHKDEICKSYVYGAAYRIDVSNGLKPERYYNETFGDNTP